MIVIDGSGFSLFYKFFLSLVLGALIGIERERKNQKEKEVKLGNKSKKEQENILAKINGKDFAGIRTFMLITFFGTISAYLSSLYSETILAISLAGFIIIILAGNLMSSYFTKQAGITTEISAVISFVIGILVFSAPQEIPILLAIVSTLILSYKTTLHSFALNLKTNEYFDTIKFLLVAFVILPLLKNIPSFGPFDAINLHEIWLMVVFVSGLSYIGYILIKIFGSNRGTMLTGILGGILSSTAVVTSLANKSKENKNTHSNTSFAIAAGVASSTMFLRVLVEVSILNINLIEKLAFPMILLALAGYVSVSAMYKKEKHTETELSFSSPLMLKPAIKFGFFYGFVLLISKALGLYIGDKGILIAALISGIADVDAITIFVARSSTIDPGIGIMAIIIASIMNTIVKIWIAKSFGTKEFGNNLLKVLSASIIVGLVFLVFI